MTPPQDPLRTALEELLAVAVEMDDGITEHVGRGLLASLRAAA